MKSVLFNIVTLIGLVLLAWYDQITWTGLLGIVMVSGVFSLIDTLVYVLLYKDTWQEELFAPKMCLFMAAHHMFLISHWCVHQEVYKNDVYSLVFIISIIIFCLTLFFSGGEAYVRFREEIDPEGWDD